MTGGTRSKGGTFTHKRHRSADPGVDRRRREEIVTMGHSALSFLYPENPDPILNPSRMRAGHGGT
ncbi:MAG: hypothetical protein RID23_01505 [Roseovarius sp.]